MPENVRKHFEEARTVLDAFINNSNTFTSIARAGGLMVESLGKGGKIISCGNGGSMCDAMHFAEELTGRYRQNRAGLSATAISDPGHISCVANDFGYDYIFSRYLEARARSGDCPEVCA